MDTNSSLPYIPLIFLEFMVPSLPCILFPWAVVQAHHSHGASQQRRCFSNPDCRRVTVTLTSNTDPTHDSHIPPGPDTAIKAHCKPPLKQHCPSPWSVSPHLSTESQQRKCCHTHLQSSLAFCIVQTQPRPNWALCPGPRTFLSKELSCHPQFCTPPIPLNLDP